MRVGVLRGTTGEARLLQITGLANGDGVLARGTRVQTPRGTVVSGEDELLSALRDGMIDAVARGEVGNGEAARASDNAFVVSAVDSVAEYGGFAFDADDTAMLACIDERLDWLTDGRRIGYAEWRANPGVFLARAARWNPE